MRGEAPSSLRCLPPPCQLRSYATYVDALDACSRDNLEYVKDRAVKALFELLSAKPEQASYCGPAWDAAAGVGNSGGARMKDRGK